MKDLSAPDDITQDALLDGRVQLRQLRKGYRVAVDPVLLAAFVPAKEGERVLELGIGTGAVLLCLNARVPGLVLTAIEPDETLHDLAAENAGLNDCAIDIASAAVGDTVWPLADNAFDHVVFNPPFYPAGGYDAGPAATRTQAHRLEQPLAAWVKAAKRALSGKGCLTAIIHAQQVVDLLAALQEWGAVEILPVQPRTGEPASRVLVRARLGRQTPPVLRPAFILHNEGQGYTAAADAVLRDAAEIS